MTRLSNLTKGLYILKKYEPEIIDPINDKTIEFHKGRILVLIDPEKLSDEDIVKLAKLGFTAMDGFYAFWHQPI